MSLTPVTGPAWGHASRGRSAPRLSFTRLFRASFEIHRRGFAALILLGTIPAAAGAGTTLALLWSLGPQFLTSLISLNPVGLAGGPLLVIAAAALVTMLLTAQCCAVMAQITNQIADGTRPRLAVAWRETRTIVVRVLVPSLVLCGSGWLTATLGVTWFLDALWAVARSSEADGAGAVLAFFGQVLLIAAVLVVGGLLLRVRLFLFLPIASLEKVSGFAAFRRSWLLTRGSSGPILGAILAIGLAEGILGVVTGRLTDPFVADPTGLDGGGLATVVTSLMPAATVTVLTGAVSAAFTLPFLTVMSSLVHRLWTRPAPPVTQPGAWAPQSWPGGYPQPGVYPQPGGYPQQGPYPQGGPYPQPGPYPQGGTAQTS